MSGGPTFDERLTSAASSSNLAVNLERRGDVDMLIAAGKAPARLGRLVYQLMTEWDGTAKPQHLAYEDIKRIAEGMPRVMVAKKGRKGGRQVERLDIPGAQAHAEGHMATERRRILGRLKSLPALMDPHAGLLPWVVARGITPPGEKLLDVLGWWADRNCSACQGTKLQVVPGTNVQSKTPCKACHGTGQRMLPHGGEGSRISAHIELQVENARRGARFALKGVHGMKERAAGKAPLLPGDQVVVALRPSTQTPRVPASIGGSPGAHEPDEAPPCGE